MFRCRYNRFNHQIRNNRQIRYNSYIAYINYNRYNRTAVVGDAHEQKKAGFQAEGDAANPHLCEETNHAIVARILE